MLYERAGEVHLFRRPDVGGCSMGFGRLYPDYAAVGLLRTGPVGRAASLCIDAAPALALEEERLRRDPRSVFCDRPLCTFCRGTWRYNKRDMFAFYPRYALHLALRALLHGPRGDGPAAGAS
ncbi:MAG TPA: hypothetical protein VMR21_09845 [Vicinamibacteria bacterium]|nr:hypothetical protein [Vicinamibacteria bacterium]